MVRRGIGVLLIAALVMLGAQSLGGRGVRAQDENQGGVDGFALRIAAQSCDSDGANCSPLSNVTATYQADMDGAETTTFVTDESGTALESPNQGSMEGGTLTIESPDGQTLAGAECTTDDGDIDATLDGNQIAFPPDELSASATTTCTLTFQTDEQAASGEATPVGETGETPAVGGDTGDTIAEATPTPAPIGRRVAIFTGDCDQLGDEVVALNDVVRETGTPEGDDQATSAELSLTTAAPFSLQDAIENGDALVIYKGHEANSGIIACGELGGLNNKDGNLPIGLKQMNNSGFVGLALLSYNTNDASTTDVTVLISHQLVKPAS